MNYPDVWLAMGRALVPVRPGSKIPALSDWANAPIRDPDDRARWKGYSWGWVLSASDLVVDVDPRNGGTESLRKLNQLAGGGIFRQFPVVKTPRGGFHLYMTTTAGDWRKAVPEYPGIDFLSAGSYCLMPGESSEHGTYSHVVGSAPVEHIAPPAPPWLRDIVRRPAQGVIRKSTHDAITPSQLAGLLAQLPAEDFREHDAWLSIMQSAHDATDGKGLAEFVDWSTSDPKYATAGGDISARWRSLQPGKAGNVTAGTLVAEVMRRGGDFPRPSVAETMDQLPDIPEGIPRSVGEVTGTTGSVVVPVVQLSREISAIKKGVPMDGLRTLIRDIMRHSEAERDMLLGLLRVKSGYAKKHLMAAAVVTADEAAHVDPSSEVADLALRTSWDSSQYIVHAADQRFWEFSGQHWAPIPGNIMTKALAGAAERWKQLHPTSRASGPALISGGRLMMEGKLACRAELHQVDMSRHILNCLNGEVHLDPVSGRVWMEAHQAAHWQTTLLPVEYHPEATCPRFDQFLTEIFSEAHDVDAVVSYIWELIGYTIQPVKDIAAWCLLTGGGSNGKSTFISIVAALLGREHCASLSMAELVDDAHGTSILPGKLLVVDDDLDQNFRLPDGFLKKVSENKMMTANPKFLHPFAFMNTAIIWMASNSIPMTRDLSTGMMRRAHVIPFERHFKPSQQDRGLAAYVIRHELAGILAEAMRGLTRLRERGYFDLPETISIAVDKWAKKTNAVMSWMHDRVIYGDQDDKSPLSAMFRDYCEWAKENGHSKTTTAQNFSQALRDQKIRVCRSSGNRAFVYGLKLRAPDMGDYREEELKF